MVENRGGAPDQIRTDDLRFRKPSQNRRLTLGLAVRLSTSGLSEAS